MRPISCLPGKGPFDRARFVCGSDGEGFSEVDVFNLRLVLDGLGQRRRFTSGEATSSRLAKLVVDDNRQFLRSQLRTPGALVGDCDIVRAKILLIGRLGERNLSCAVLVVGKRSQAVKLSGDRHDQISHTVGGGTAFKCELWNVLCSSCSSITDIVDGGLSTLGVLRASLTLTGVADPNCARVRKLRLTFLVFSSMDEGVLSITACLN